MTSRVGCSAQPPTNLDEGEDTFQEFILQLSSQADAALQATLRPAGSHPILESEVAKWLGQRPSKSEVSGTLYALENYQGPKACVRVGYSY